MSETVWENLLERSVSDGKFIGICCFFGFCFLIATFDSSYALGFIFAVLLASIFLSKKPKRRKK